MRKILLREIIGLTIVTIYLTFVLMSIIGELNNSKRSLCPDLERGEVPWSHCENESSNRFIGALGWAYMNKITHEMVNEK